MKLPHSNTHTPTHSQFPDTTERFTSHHHVAKIRARMIRHIVWDWNGTLLDDASACVSALNILLAQRGLPEVSIDEYHRVFGFPVQEYYITLGFDFTKEDWTALARDFHQQYAKFAHQCSLRPDAQGALAKLQTLGMPMSMLSASEASILEQTVGERGLRGYFRGLYGLTDFFARSKAEAGRNMLNEICEDADDVLMVGDTVHDFEVATALGCRCILVSGGHQAGSRLEHLGCTVVNGPADVVDYVTEYGDTPKHMKQPPMNADVNSYGQG